MGTPAGTMSVVPVVEVDPKDSAAVEAAKVAKRYNEGGWMQKPPAGEIARSLTLLLAIHTEMQASYQSNRDDLKEQINDLKEQLQNAHTTHKLAIDELKNQLKAA